VDSLLARVLVGKYCNNVDFLSVKAKPGCSWGWRSILWGRDLLATGLKWDLGDGQEIRAFKDEWIFGIDNPFVGQNIMASLEDMRVGSLIDWRSFKWHVPLVEALFPAEVATKILSMYIPSRGR